MSAHPAGSKPVPAYLTSTVTCHRKIEWHWTPPGDAGGQLGRDDVSVDEPRAAAVYVAEAEACPGAGVAPTSTSAFPLDSSGDQRAPAGESNVTFTVPPSATHSCLFTSSGVIASVVGQPPAGGGGAAGVPP
ncbi:MAG TPA: hypothetical protein VKB69_07410 [Micromonosporaceae bacterium]|nr:hypothetical protein [Micromonosporaceae bacterium]